MPKEKPNMALMPKIYKRNYFDTAMFWYAKGQREIMPAISVEKSLYNFFKSIGEEDFNIESAQTTFTRMQKEMYEDSKTDK